MNAPKPPRITWENKITLGNLVQIGLIILGGLSAWFGAIERINSAETLARSIEVRVEKVDTVLAGIPPLANRVSTLETRISLDDARRRDFEDDTKTTLRDTAALMSKILEQQATILEAIKQIRN